jgi:hypothetical protein
MWLVAAALAFVAVAGIGIASATRAVDGSETPADADDGVDAAAAGANDGVDDSAVVSLSQEEDACGGCDDGLVCISNGCHYPHAVGVLEQYREFLGHWNEGNSKGFFAQYSDPLVCYHNRGSFALASLRVLRGQHFATPDGSLFAADNLAVLASEEDSVVLMDTGRFLAGDGREKPHVRLIEYRRFENRGWRITIEASRASHGCASDWFE